MESMELKRHYLSDRGEMPWWERRRWVRTVQREVLDAISRRDMTVHELLTRLDTELLYAQNPVVGLITVRRLLMAMPEVGRGYQRRWRWLFLPVRGGRKLRNLTPPQRNVLGNYPREHEFTVRLHRGDFD